MNCPKCNTRLEFVSGQFDTGAVAPDGYRESTYEEGYYCAKCGQVYDITDLDLDCPMCGAEQCFSIDLNDPSLGHCAKEGKSWRLKSKP